MKPYTTGLGFHALFPLTVSVSCLCTQAAGSSQASSCPKPPLSLSLSLCSVCSSKSTGRCIAARRRRAAKRVVHLLAFLVAERLCLRGIALRAQRSYASSIARYTASTGGGGGRSLIGMRMM